jgi:hypothetical protein
MFCLNNNLKSWIGMIEDIYYQKTGITKTR